MSEAWKDFKRHGGGTTKMPTTRGKVLCTCVGCGGQEYLYPKRVYDCRSRAKCKACGWELEPSKASRAKAMKAHEIRPLDEMV